MTNRKLLMPFRLASRSVTLDDLELLFVWIFWNFYDFADLDVVVGLCCYVAMCVGC